MTDEPTLLRAIAARPDDDTPRLALADWLDVEGTSNWTDNHATERAELIRLQCGLAHGVHWQSGQRVEGKELEELTGREQELLETCRTEWMEPLWELGVTSIELSRGIPEVAAMPLASFIQHGGTLAERMPTCTGLNLGYNSISDAGAAALANSAHLVGLKCLDIRYNVISDVGATALAGSPHLSGLTTLNLGNNRISTAGAAALAGSRHLSGLISLNLWHNSIGPEGTEAIAGSPHLSRLTHLELRGNGIGNRGAAALAGSERLAGLTTLELGNNGIGPAGSEAIARSAHMSRLTTLNLGYNNIGDAGAAALASSAHLSGLTALNLGANGIGDVGAAALAGSAHLSGLTALNLGDNHISEAAEAVAMLDAYNAAVTSGRSPTAMGTPSTASCRWCPFKSLCPAFWAAVSPDWSEQLDGEVIRGTVTAEPQPLLAPGARSLIVAVLAGTEPSGTTLRLAPMPQQIHPALAGITAGQEVIMTRLGRKANGTLYPLLQTVLFTSKQIEGV